MKRFLIAALVALTVSPAVYAQGVSLGPTNRTNTQLMNPGGSYYYPGFGYSSHPLPNYGGVAPYNPYGGYGGYGGYGAPVMGAPLAVPGFSGHFNFGRSRINYWRSPSGYYYPWGGGYYNQPAPVYYINQGVTTPQLPPLSSQFSDMEKYLDESREKGKLSQNDYARLFRRLQDVRGKYDHQRAAGGGVVDQNDESNIRRDVDLLGGEISRAIKPVASK